MLLVGGPHCLDAQVQLSWAVSSAQNWLQEQTGLGGTSQGMLLLSRLSRVSLCATP